MPVRHRWRFVEETQSGNVKDQCVHCGCKRLTFTNGRKEYDVDGEVKFFAPNCIEKKKSVDPKTPEQWREAVNLAEAFLLLDSARLYNLVVGGPKVDAERCDDILRRGKVLGYTPDVETVNAIIRGMAA